MNELKEKDAVYIHDVIMHSGEKDFIELYKQALKSQAEMRMGMYVSNSGWYGTPLPDTIKNELDDRFGIDQLYNSNVLSIDGNHIELDVLAGALPDKIISCFFEYDVEKRAKEAGFDLEDVKKDLKAAFKGTVGEPGKSSFGIILDETAREHIGEFHAVLGLGSLRHPYDKATIDRLQKKDGLSERFQKAIRQGQEVYDQHLDADSVYVITAEDSPAAMQMAIQLLGLPRP